MSEDRYIAADDRGSVTPQELALSDRRSRAVRMRNTGMSYAKIADALGISKDTVRRDIRAVLREHLGVPAEDLVASQRAILLEMRQRLYVSMLQGDTKAMDTMLRTMEHEAKLFGLYAPTRVAVAHGSEDFAATAAQLMAEIGMTVPGEFDRPGPSLAEIDGPPIIDAEVEQAIADVGPETGGTDEWVQ